VRRNYDDALRPFEAEYANLDNLDRPTYRPPAEVNPVEWGMPVQQPTRAVPASTANWQRVVGEEANNIHYEAGVQSALNRVAGGDTTTLTGMKDARSFLLSEARTVGSSPNKARTLNRMAEAMQRDIDDTLLASASNDVRNLSGRYRRDVIGPYDKVRKGGVLQPGSDPSEAWKSLRSAGREDLQRLAAAVDPWTREVIRRRAVGEIINREDQFIGLQSGSGAPAWRDMDKRGMGAFFTREEWRGLQRLTGQSAFFKHPATRVGAAVIGGTTGGMTGVGMALFADWLATTTGGRLFLARAGRMTRQTLRDSTAAVLSNPGTLQAEIQVTKDREDSGQ
jgi:hypothetical protein